MSLYSIFTAPKLPKEHLARLCGQIKSETMPFYPIMSITYFFAKITFYFI